MSKNSREATESAAGAILRMARLNCYLFWRAASKKENLRRLIIEKIYDKISLKQETDEKKSA